MSRKKPTGFDLNNKNSNSSSNSSSDSDDTDSDQSNDEVDRRKIVKNRQKRGIDWCATTELPSNEPSASSSGFRAVVWPPASNSTASSGHYKNTPLSVGTIWTEQKHWNYNEKLQLVSQTDYFLAINADGTVNGTRDKNDLHTVLQLINVSRPGEPGRVRILGTLTEQYLAMGNSGRYRGRLYAHYNASDPNTEWEEIPIGDYNSFRNVHSVTKRRKQGQGWFLGITKSGKGKRGKRTRFGQKATKFLPKGRG